MPFLAPWPVPTMMAVGVARPNAQGQEMTKTEMAILRANSKDSPTNNQMTKAATAMRMTAGTKIELILSASLAMGAFEDPASSMRRIDVYKRQPNTKRLIVLHGKR